MDPDGVPENFSKVNFEKSAEDMKNDPVICSLFGGEKRCRVRSQLFFERYNYEHSALS